jgi:hypothetical protein
MFGSKLQQSALNLPKSLSSKNTISRYINLQEFCKIFAEKEQDQRGRKEEKRRRKRGGGERRGG